MLQFSAAQVIPCDLLQPHFASGNKCGHRPDFPVLQLPEPTPTGPGGYPRFLTLTGEKIDALYFKPKKFTRIFGSGSRIIRSERREAICRTAKALLHYFCMSDRICTKYGKPAFRIDDLPTLKDLAKKAGLSVKRFSRALALMVKSGMVECVQPRKYLDGNYYGLPAIRSFSDRFFEILGMDRMNVKEKRKAKSRQHKKFGPSPAQRFVSRLLSGSNDPVPNNAGLAAPENSGQKKRELFNFYQKRFVDRTDPPKQLPLPKPQRAIHPDQIKQWYEVLESMKIDNLEQGGDIQPSRWACLTQVKFGFQPPDFDMETYKREIFAQYGRYR